MFAPCCRAPGAAYDDAKTSYSDGTVNETKTTSSKFFNFDTGLNQGGQLGVVAFF
jgi:hypothetical protein